jgi:glutathione S-transferase
MLILYVRTGCPFSAKVIEEAKALHLELDLRNITYLDYANELEERGGKLQTPYLVDEEGATELYESDAIITHLNNRFRKT